VSGLKESFDTIAAGYDAQRRWIIPDFEWFYTVAVRAATVPAREPSILDIGAGTGFLSAMLLGVYPGATLTLMDISEKMLEVARRRFEGREKVRFLVADYRDADLGGPFDIICSALLASAPARRLSLWAEPFHPPPGGRGDAGALPADLCRPGGRRGLRER